jgi:hypothetical protein
MLIFQSILACAFSVWAEQTALRALAVPTLFGPLTIKTQRLRDVHICGESTLNLAAKAGHHVGFYTRTAGVRQTKSPWISQSNAAELWAAAPRPTAQGLNAQAAAFGCGKTCCGLRRIRRRSELRLAADQYSST